MTRRKVKSYGYLAIQIRDRGPIGRGLRQEFNAASKAAWHATAVYFHAHLRDKRFTESHAKEAGYMARKGELLPRESKAFRRSYYGRKLLSAKYGGGPGLALPLVFSGRTRRAVKQAAISSTSRGGKAAYRGAAAFNFRHPKSKIRMSEEFKRITQSETIELARVYDRELDERWQSEPAS